MTDESDQTPKEARDRVRREAKEIADAGSQVRARVRRLLVESIEAGRLSAEEINRVTDRIVEGALEGAADERSDERQRVFREVVDGLADGYQTAANATRIAVEEATSQGASYAREELDRVGDDLRALDEMFVDTVRTALKRARGQASESARDLAAHAERSSEQIRPSISAALAALRDQPGRVAAGAASVWMMLMN
jgi:polyhydroxyalkanoate synthesis regulator phasin